MSDSTAPNVVQMAKEAPGGQAAASAIEQVNPAILDAAARHYGRVMADGGLPALNQIAPILGDILKRAQAG